MHGSRRKIPSKKSRPYIYNVKFLALIGAPSISDISRLRVKLLFANEGKIILHCNTADLRIKRKTPTRTNSSSRESLGISRRCIHLLNRFFSLSGKRAFLTD
jgi:hypothetical protein